MAWITSGQLFCWKILVDGSNLHKGGEFFFSSKKSREMPWIANLFMLFVKMSLCEKSQDFCVKNWAPHTKTLERGEKKFHALLSLPTDGGKRMTWQTATSIQVENNFVWFKYYGIWQHVIGESFLTLRRILPFLASVVISPWIKSLTWGWNGTQILWLPSWQPSYYAGWGVIILKMGNNLKE